MTLLEEKAVDAALQAQIKDLERSVERLSLLQAHDALCLLKNALANRHAKTSVHTPDVTIRWQPAFVCIRRCSAPGLIQDPQRRP